MKRFVACLLLSGVIGLIVGCGTGPKVITCEDLTVLELTRNDAKVISDRLAEGILKHNEFGHAIGCKQFKPNEGT